MNICCYSVLENKICLKKNLEENETIRLSFIGGRRPSLLPAAGTNKENEQCPRADNEDQNSAVLKQQNGSTCSVEIKQQKESVCLAADETFTVNVANEQSHLKEEEEIHRDAVMAKQNSVLLTTTTSTTAINEISSNTNTEEFKRQQEILQTKLKYAQEELGNWNELLVQDVSLENGSLVDVNVSDDINSVFDINKEMCELRDIRDLWFIESKTLLEKKKELQMLQELVKKKLDKQLVNFIADDNSLDMQTPRHLIKKIVNLQ